MLYKIKNDYLILCFLILNKKMKDPNCNIIKDYDDGIIIKPSRKNVVDCYILKLKLKI